MKIFAEMLELFPAFFCFKKKPGNRESQKEKIPQEYYLFTFLLFLITFEINKQQQWNRAYIYKFIYV